MDYKDLPYQFGILRMSTFCWSQWFNTSFTRICIVHTNVSKLFFRTDLTMLDILKGKSILVSWTFKILVSDYFYTASSTNTMANSPTKKLFVRSKSKYTLKCQQFWEGEKEKKNAAAGRIFPSEEYLYKIRVCIRKGKICHIRRCDNLTKFLLHNIILFGIWILK